MVRQDIVTGLRNGLERGNTMEQAKQSLINAGYNSGDVLESANFLTGGLGDKPLEDPETNALNQYSSTTSKTNIAEPKKKFPLTLTVLVLILVFLLSSLLAAFIFREQLISFFEGLFS